MKNLSPSLVTEVVKALQAADGALADVWNAEAAADNADHEEVQQLQAVLDDIAAVLQKIERA